MQVKDIVKKVKQIEIRSRRKMDATLMGQYHSAFKGQGMTFSEVRSYQYGDDIRRIDWNKTARFQEPFVKLMEEERELTMVLIVDVSQSMNYGTKNQLKKEYVAEICASLGFSAVNSNDKVGLILYADKVYKVIPPKKGRKHVLSIISTILSTDYLPTSSNIDVAFQTMMAAFKKKSLVFLFSDFQDKFENKLLRVGAAKHQIIGMRIYDEKDEAIPDIGYVLMSDAETGNKIWVNTSNKRWRYDFTEQKRNQIKEVKVEFDKANANFISLKTGADYSKQLHLYFQSK